MSIDITGDLGNAGLDIDNSIHSRHGDSLVASSVRSELMATIHDERPNLDILRSFALAMVLIDHLVPTLKYQVSLVNPALLTFRPHIGQAAHVGQAGVLAFFVHTSLVLMYSLDRLYQSGHEIAVALRFYVRRFFRIYPLSICCIGVALLFGIPSMPWQPTTPITWKVIASNLLLIQNLWTKQNVVAPLWSLPYEVQMYIVLPFLHLYARRGRPIIGLLVLTGLFCLVGTLLAIITGHMNLAAFVPCFIAGVLCYAIGRKSRPIFPASLWPAYLLTLILSYCVAHLWSPEPIFWVGWIYCIILGLTINLFHECQARRVNTIFKLIAKYSYGMYLWHVPFLYLTFTVLNIRAPLLGTLVFFPLTIGFSIATYHIIEAPMINVGRRMSSNICG
jgi:peptidoglycan/LPS O-acetylase OafA/YrhL